MKSWAESESRRSGPPARGRAISRISLRRTASAKASRPSAVTTKAPVADDQPVGEVGLEVAEARAAGAVVAEDGEAVDRHPLPERDVARGGDRRRPRVPDAVAGEVDHLAPAVEAVALDQLQPLQERRADGVGAGGPPRRRQQPVAEGRGARPRRRSPSSRPRRPATGAGPLDVGDGDPAALAAVADRPEHLRVDHRRRRSPGAAARFSASSIEPLASARSTSSRSTGSRASCAAAGSAPGDAAPGRISGASIGSASASRPQAEIGTAATATPRRPDVPARRRELASRVRGGGRP